VVLIAQFVLLLACAWYAVRQVLLPITRFTHAVNVSTRSFIRVIGVCRSWEMAARIRARSCR
jgi:hypothetical protein